MFKSFFLYIRDSLFPSYCLSCKRLGQYICIDCAKKLYFIENDICIYCRKSSYLGLTHASCRRPFCLDGVKSFFWYKGLMRNLLINTKYKGVSDIVNSLSTIIIQRFQNDIIELNRIFGKTLCLPIPLSKKRLNKRGFNQSSLFARNLCRYLNADIDERSLIRIKDTKSQSLCLSFKERESVIRGVFSLKNFSSQDKLFKKIILFDDVLTSGATLKEACRVCKKNGAEFVYSITIARSWVKRNGKK